MNWHKIYDYQKDSESEHLASRLKVKNLLEKKQRYPTFKPEKVHFCIVILLTSPKTLVTSVMSKINDSTKYKGYGRTVSEEIGCK